MRIFLIIFCLLDEDKSRKKLVGGVISRHGDDADGGEIIFGFGPFCMV